MSLTREVAIARKTLADFNVSQWHINWIARKHVSTDVVLGSFLKSFRHVPRFDALSPKQIMAGFAVVDAAQYFAFWRVLMSIGNSFFDLDVNQRDKVVRMIMAQRERIDMTTELEPDSPLLTRDRSVLVNFGKRTLEFIAENQKTAVQSQLLTAA